jgi:tRNA dimethylallyltransferase
VALEVAGRAAAEIVSVDSMQVYRGMDIGTAKPSAEQRGRVPHHLIDVAEPEDPFTVAQFQDLGRRALDLIGERGAPVLIVGGSGLHFRALVDPLEFPPHDPEVRAVVEALPVEEARRDLVVADPRSGEVLDLANPRRVARALEVWRLTGLTPSARAAASSAVAVRNYRPLLPLVAVGFDPGPLLAARVASRLQAMVSGGLLEEVQRVAPRMGRTAAQAVGYKELLPTLRGEASEVEGIRRAVDATCALAGRQRTFFRRDPRIRWLEWDDDPGRRAAALTGLLEEAGWTS